tara:strand:- start:353 stop:1345 length:993 start_codon:yes stop_codon:yes gene_type:complete
MQLIDQYNREISYLRISVTDRCDLRCVYCMKEKMTFLPKKEILTLEEIERLCDNFIELGVKKIRITGGEPLVRKDLLHLIKNLNSKKNHSNLEEITITTNGSLLSNYAEQLKENGIDRINVSLDTIDDQKYKKITRNGKLKNVLAGIEEAIKYNIKVKINTVALKNFNENEFLDLIEWSNSKLLDLTFIEVMPMDETGYKRELQFVALDQIFNSLDERYSFYETKNKTGGPSKFYKSNKLKNTIGFISPLTNNFCSNCNRVRITSTGRLYMCLGQNDYVDFKNILRNDFSDNYIKDQIKASLRIKAKKHDFMIGDNIKPYLKRHMNVTGG